LWDKFSGNAIVISSHLSDILPSDDPSRIDYQQIVRKHNRTYIEEMVKKRISENEREGFDWRSETEKKTIDENKIYSHFKAAEIYLVDALSEPIGDYKTTTKYSP